MISKKVRVIAALCSLTLSLRAQTNQWQKLENLRPGTPISVVKHARQSCELVNVTDAELICNKNFGRVARRLVFVREQVREVRLELPDDNKLIVGAITGAAAGVLFGFLAGQQSNDPETRGYAYTYGIPIGAFIGGVVGRHIHRHGAVVYRK